MITIDINMKLSYIKKNKNYTCENLQKIYIDSNLYNYKYGSMQSLLA